MKGKTLLALLAAFLILVAAALAPKWTDRFGSESDEPTPSDIGLASFTEGTTTKVSITLAGGKPTVLDKVGGVWKVGGKLASQQKVDDYFKVLAKLGGGTLVSRNPDNHANFSATAKEGTVLVLTRDGKDTTFVVGRSGDTMGSFYIKRDGSDDLYELTGDLVAKLSQDAKAWQTTDPVAAPPPGQPGMPGGVGGAPGVTSTPVP